MITISLCMIVKNEEENLPSCLDCVKGIVDEIIIVDTGSTDATKEIAAGYGARIFDFAWIDDFSAARNYAFAQATQEYILWLDADDILLEEDIEKFKRLKETLPPDTDVVMMRYHSGRDENGTPTFTYARERLLRRGAGHRWKEPVHECIEVRGNVYESDAAVTHTRRGGGEGGGRNVRIYEAILQSGGDLSPRGMYYYARELKDHGRFKEAAEWFRMFLNTGLGWVEDCIAACNMAGYCLMQLSLWEEALSALLGAFRYDAPRPETCSYIAYTHKAMGELRLAAYWFEMALNAPPPRNKWGFTQPEYAGYIPCLELAVCYDMLGEREKAEAYNERAAGYKPDSAAVAYNRRYFRGKG